MRIVIAFSLLLVLTACAVSNAFDASPESIKEAAYAPDGPPKLTLFTVVSNTSGSVGHTALMVSGSQQVIFDPAGSFKHVDIPKRGDVLYGATPEWVDAYKSAHARKSHHVVSQEMTVTAEQAERALALVTSNGAVPAAFCTRSTSDILRQVPGFEDVQPTFYPEKLMAQIAQRPDVKTERYYEQDDGDVADGIRAPNGNVTRAARVTP